MRLLLDQGLPRGACEILERGGHDVLHVADVGLSTADDEAILDRALAENRTVVTLDADFHAILAQRGATGPSVIRIRIEGLCAEALAELVMGVMGVAGADLDRGAAVTVAHGDVTRIRPLPF